MGCYGYGDSASQHALIAPRGSATPERVTFERASFERTIFSDCTFERLTIRAIDYLSECHFSDYQIQRVPISMQPIWASTPWLPRGAISAKDIMTKSEHLSLEACAEQWTYICHGPMQEKYKDISLASVIFDKFSISYSFVSNLGYWKSLFLSQMLAIYFKDDHRF